MNELFASGRVVDGILALLVAEFLLLILIRNRIMPSVGRWELFANLGAGAALLCTLRGALRGAPWQVLAPWLLLALLLHVCNLVLRAKN